MCWLLFKHSSHNYTLLNVEHKLHKFFYARLKFYRHAQFHVTTSQRVIRIMYLYDCVHSLCTRLMYCIIRLKMYFTAYVLYSYVLYGSVAVCTLAPSNISVLQGKTYNIRIHLRSINNNYSFH